MSVPAATCAAILLTHSHYDHFGALAELADSTGAPVWLPEAELDVFRRPDDLPGVAEEAIEAGAGALWIQLGLHSDEAVRIAHEAELDVVAA